MYLAPSSVFRLIGQARFDESDLALRRTDAMAEFNYGPLLTQGIYTFSAADPLRLSARTSRKSSPRWA